MTIFSKKTKPRKSISQAPRRSPLTTYYRSDTTEESASPFSKKSAPKKARKYLYGILDAVLVIGITIALGYSLMIRPNPKLIVDNYSFHSQSQYQAAAASQIRHLNNRNKITFNQQSLATNLEKQFPEISRVDVELPLFSEQPTIRLSISKPSFFISSQGMRYIIDSNGKAVSKTDKLPGITNLVTINDQSGFKILSGSQVLSGDSVNFINTLLAECRRAGVSIQSLTLPAVPEEIDLRTKDQPYFTKFYLGGDVLSQSGQFLASRKHFTETHQTPSQYLDVRVPGKVFYK